MLNLGPLTLTVFHGLYFVDGGVVPLDDVHNTAMAAEGGEK